MDGVHCLQLVGISGGDLALGNILDTRIRLPGTEGKPL